MKKNIEKLGRIYFVLLLILFAGNVQAETDRNEPAKNVPVASRRLSDTDRTQLAMSREERFNENLGCDEGECDCDEPQLKEKSLSTREFYQLHYGAFHRMCAVAIDGSTFELEDGSVWAVKYTSDMYTILGWSARDSLVIEQWDYSGLEYKIVNQTRDQYVNATPTLGPLYEGIHMHWIVGKDSFWGTLTLEDGSKWEPYMSSEVAKWLPNDTVVLGAYRYGSLYNTILININLLDYVRVKLKWAK